MIRQQNKWWGWGNRGKRYRIKNRDELVSYLESRIGQLETPIQGIDIGDLGASPPYLSQQDVSLLKDIVGEKWVKLDENIRILYSFGKSYKDLICLRNGHVDLVTDAVVFPGNETEIESILQWAIDSNVSIIPFGGGTSVVGGLERDEFSNKVITISLERFTDLIEIDKMSMTARCQAGILGPDLEKRLNKAGFSLGHFPQSFEFSTLGGWIATRGAGQASTKYGKIEHLVESVRIITPECVIESGPFPAQATGSDLLQVIIGSEGTFGIITEAVIKIHEIPAVCDTRGYLFKDIDKGVEAIRRMLQVHISPAIIRLSDINETAISVKLRELEKGKLDLKQRIGEFYLGLRGLSLKEGFLLILGFEGGKEEVRYEKKLATGIIRRYDGVYLGKSPGRSWQESRFEHPYLRDELISLGVLVDTLETSTTWSNLLPLYRTVLSALNTSFESMDTLGLVLAHISHAYTDGASLYFTFLLPAKAGKEIDQWERIKSDTIESFIKNGGSLSHHHGIGKDHIRWMETFLGENSVEIMHSIKRQLDPHHILNPGKLIDTFLQKKKRRVRRDECSSRTREDNISRFNKEQFDLLVIGGGITGAGIAWDAALRGMKVAVVEKGDFGSGTSSKSSKMIHGGLRYLKQLNVKLVRESLHERGLLLKLAPHLVHPKTHIIPIYGRTALKMMELRLGLTGYDILAGSLNIANHEKLSREDVLERIPTLKKEKLKGGFLYWDCLVNDARLTLTVILSAVRAGAVVANYVKTRGFVSNGKQISGVKYEDSLTGKRGVIQASLIVNATGPWSDEVRQMADIKENHIRPTKGIHLIFKKEQLPSNDVVLIFSDDGRPLYVVPAGDCCYVGTTDTDYDENLDNIRATTADLNYVLNTIQSYFPQQGIGPDDVLGYWAGVRPLVAMEGAPSRVSRDYTINHEQKGLITVAGGKLTTFREMAEQVVNEILVEYGSQFEQDFQACQTESTKLIGGDLEDFELYLESVRQNLSEPWSIDSEILDQLVLSYGTRYLTILGYGLDNPKVLKPLFTGSKIILAEVLHAVDSEMAITLEDFMERRTGLKYFSHDHGLSVLNRIAKIMGKRLGWGFSESRRQVKHYLESIHACTTFDMDVPVGS